jgi:hypothetical protein
MKKNTTLDSNKNLTNEIIKQYIVKNCNNKIRTVHLLCNGSASNVDSCHPIFSSMTLTFVI